LLVTLVGCGSTSGSTAASRTSPPVSTSASPTHHPVRHTPTPNPSAPTTSAKASGAAGGATKLLVFVVENHSLTEMRSQMPWTYGLGQRYGYATDYHAMTHPSLPNYLAIAGGSTFGVHDDADPSAHPISGPSVFGEALAHGRTARVYADAMPAPCTLTDSGGYAVRHNPWTYFTDERHACEQLDVPLDGFAGDVRSGQLPDAGMVVPDVCHDAHDCPLATADAWLEQEVGLAMSGPDFRSGRLAIVVTADEDDGSQGNVVLTTVVHPSVQGVVTTSPLSHLSLSRLYSQVLGLPPLRGAASAPDMATAFGLALGH
jgi:phosphatidylinositol-3-phosphatase